MNKTPNKPKTKIEKVKKEDLPSKNTLMKVLGGDFLTKSGSQEN